MGKVPVRCSAWVGTRVHVWEELCLGSVVSIFFVTKSAHIPKFICSYPLRSLLCVNLGY